MKTIYENEEYFVCESLEELAGKLLNYKKAALVTNMELFKSQFYEISKVVNDHFGSDSEELRKSFTPLLFCGNCGVAFTQTLLRILTMPYNRISGAQKVDGCPKCGSQKLSVIYKL
jgi:hypothetical protein